jgi:hypothetical protein
MKEQMKKVAKSAVKAHEAAMHKGAKKMSKGGKTDEAIKAMGRNMAKVKAQGGR